MVPIWQTTSFSKAPAHVAREALRTAAELATGEAAAWRDVKRAKGVRSHLFMSRVGTHHGLLFRVSNDQLEVLDLATRDGLGVSLKRY